MPFTAPEIIAAILAAGAVVSALIVLRKTSIRLHAAYKERARDAVAVRDAILGREAVRDSITGLELAPPLPGVGARMAHQEQQMELLTTAVARIADQQHQYHELKDTVDRHDLRLVALEEATLERIVTRAESTQAWGAVQAALRHDGGATGPTGAIDNH